jgi:hypothetical protein
MASGKKGPKCSNCEECGHTSSKCPERPFEFYSNREFPKVTLIRSKALPKKLKAADCILCGLTFDSKDKTVVKTACGHYFHNDCLAINWEQSMKQEEPTAKCPECKYDYAFDMGFDMGIEILHNARDIYRRRRAEMRYQDDLESQTRHLTDEEIEQILAQEDPYHRLEDIEKSFLREQLKYLTYDKDYSGYYSNDVSIGLYDQARDRIQEWNRGGTMDDHFQPANKQGMEALSEEFFRKSHPELVGEVMSYLKPKDDPHVKEFYEEQLKNDPLPPPGHQQVQLPPKSRKNASSKKSSASSKKPSSGLSGAKTRKRNKSI